MTEQRHAGLGLHPAPADAGGDHVELIKRRQVIRRTKIAAAVFIVLLALGAGRTMVSRAATNKSLATDATENAKQYVRTTIAKRGGKGQTLSLPGSLQGVAQSPIGARASGYLKRWTKDIGATVAKGELLAEIETPEIDQQLSQAVAARQQAEASLALGKSTVDRWESLRKKDVVSQQDLDERRSGLAQAQANLAAADANVQRLRQLEGFKRIVAPFAGVITRRNVDVGDLIDAGGAAARPLFMLSQIDSLRVYLNVPQTYSQLVKTGQQVTVSQGELRGQTFKGVVARTAASIDAASRTMHVEVALPNADGRLLPGAYVQVLLPLPASDSLVVPTNTLMFRGEGTMVAVVDKQGKVTLKRVTVGRNYGDNFEVLDGIGEGQELVLNPPDWMADGVQVAVAPPAAASGAGSGAGAGAARAGGVGKEPT